MSEHYTDGRRWSYISQAWIADYDAAVSECEGQSVLTTLRALKQYGMQLEREKADLEDKLRQVEQERDQAREALRSVRSLCRDKSFPGTMNMRLDEIERHVCKALVEG